MVVPSGLHPDCEALTGFARCRDREVSLHEGGELTARAGAVRGAYRMLAYRRRL